MTNLEFYNKLERTSETAEEKAFNMIVEEIQRDAITNIDRGTDYYKCFLHYKKWLREEKTIE